MCHGEKKMTESDWKAFREMVPDLRERYIRNCNTEISAILQTANQTQTERFWTAHEKITEKARILQQCLDGHSRSRMPAFISEMLDFGLMEPKDLEVFSEDVRERATAWHDEKALRTKRVTESRK
jgi:hypothetical protein